MVKTHWGSARPDARLFLLGGFQLAVQGETVDLPFGVQRLIALLALLHRPRPRASIAGTLWPEPSRERANGNLRGTLWRLHRFRGLVEANQSRLSLIPTVVVDVREMVLRARSLVDPTIRLPGHLELQLFSMDLLPSWDEEWLLDERERLLQLRLHALEILSERLANEGRSSEAVQAALAAIAGDPFRESARRALINAFLAEGNVADALLEFDAYRRILQDELGVDASPGLRNLARGLRNLARSPLGDSDNLDG